MSKLVEGVTGGRPASAKVEGSRPPLKNRILKDRIDRYSPEAIHTTQKAEKVAKEKAKEKQAKEKSKEPK